MERLIWRGFPGLFRGILDNLFRISRPGHRSPLKSPRFARRILFNCIRRMLVSRQYCPQSLYLDGYRQVAAVPATFGNFRTSRICATLKPVRRKFRRKSMPSKNRPMQAPLAAVRPFSAAMKALETVEAGKSAIENSLFDLSSAVVLRKFKSFRRPTPSDRSSADGSGERIDPTSYAAFFFEFGVN